MILETTNLIIPDSDLENFNAIYRDLLKTKLAFPGCLSGHSSRQKDKMILETWWSDEDSLTNFNHTGAGKSWISMLDKFSATKQLTSVREVNSIGLDSCGG